MKQFTLSTTRQEEFVEITPQLRQLLKTQEWSDGALLVYVPHTTAGVTLNENADPAVKKDLLTALDRLIRDEILFTHSEGNSPAHFKASLVGSQQLIIVENGQLVLGTWQGVFFCEFDGPRQRQVYLQFLGK